MKDKKNLKIGLLLVLFVLVIAGGIYTYNNFKPATTEGTKEITIEIIIEDEISNTYTIKTEEEYLRGALEQESLISGDDSDFGLFVTTVDGYTVDNAKQEWWMFTKNTADLMTGVDDTVINDGDKFEITLTIGY